MRTMNYTAGSIVQICEYFILFTSSTRTLASLTNKYNRYVWNEPIRLLIAVYFIGLAPA